MVHRVVGVMVKWLVAVVLAIILGAIFDGLNGLIEFYPGGWMFGGFLQDWGFWTLLALALLVWMDQKHKVRSSIRRQT